MTSPSSPSAETPEVDAIITSLYRRFKDWSKQGFGPDDVTWCEVKAEVVALCSALPVPTQIKAGETIGGEALAALKELVDLVAEETMGDCTADDADDESVGWTTDGPLPMTFGHVRRAQRAITDLSAPPKGNAEGVKALEWCVSVCDHAIEHYKGPVAMKIRREIAVELARRSVLTPSPISGEVAALREVYEAARGLCFGEDWNFGTHALEHGYRQKLIDAVAKIDKGHPVAIATQPTTQPEGDGR